MYRDFLFTPPLIGFQENNYLYLQPTKNLQIESSKYFLPAQSDATLNNLKHLESFLWILDVLYLVSDNPIQSSLVAY